MVVLYLLKSREVPRLKSDITRSCRQGRFFILSFVISVTMTKYERRGQSHYVVHSTFCDCFGSYITMETTYKVHILRHVHQPCIKVRLY